MTDPIYRIAKWAETFETADSKRHKQLAWVSFPVDRQTNGYQSLIDQHPVDAPALYGAWAALLTVAAGCPIRGTLANSKGEPLSIARIARMTYMPAEVFERLFEWAKSEEIGWLEVVPNDANDSQPVANQPTTGQQTASERTTNPTNKPNEPMEIAASNDADVSSKSKKRKTKARQYSAEFESWWCVYWNRSNKAAASDSLNNAIERIIDDTSIAIAVDRSTALEWLVARTKRYAACRPRTVENLHGATYLNDDRFNDELPSDAVASRPRPSFAEANA